MKKATCVLSILLILMILSSIPAGVTLAATSTCPDCNGTGAVKCVDCNGSGEAGMCTVCNGMGFDEESGDTCQNCDGEGIFKCGTCGGYGDLTCSTCNGTGSVTIPDPQPVTQTVTPNTQPATGKKTSNPKPVIKKKNPITIKTSVRVVKAAKLKKAKKTVRPLIIKKAKGSVKIKKVKKGTSAAIYKKIAVNAKNGAITLARGKYKKGTYKIRLNITAAGTKNYKKFTKTVTVKIRIR